MHLGPEDVRFCDVYKIKQNKILFPKSCNWRVLCWRAQPGFDPGTSRTRSETHTPITLSRADKLGPPPKHPQAPLKHPQATPNYFGQRV